jgi:hypothetical protein
MVIHCPVSPGHQSTLFSQYSVQGLLDDIVSIRLEDVEFGDQHFILLLELVALRASKARFI